MENGDWCTIESDPGVFTELIKGIGVKNIQVEEIYSLDDEALLQQLQPIYGLIFLFKWTSKQEPRECLMHHDPELFFANQVIQNACATQALLAILLNNKDIEISPELQNFKQFVKDLDSQNRGLAISNLELVRNVHNSFARPEPFVFTKETRRAKDSDDIYHFVSFVPFKGKLYELDGLQKGPILLGSFQNNDWLPLAKTHINERILKYSEKEVRFNLMAVISDKKTIAEQNLHMARKQMYTLYLQLKQNKQPLDEQREKDFQELSKIFKEEDAKDAMNIENVDIQKKLSELESSIQIATGIIEDEILKMEKYRKENIRRKHNYIPFILEMLKMAAQKGQLNELITKAKQIEEENLKKEKERKEQQAKKQEEEAKKNGQPNPADTKSQQPK